MGSWRSQFAPPRGELLKGARLFNEDGSPVVATGREMLPLRRAEPDVLGNHFDFRKSLGSEFADGFRDGPAPPVRNISVQVKQMGAFNIAELPGVERGKHVSARPGGPSVATFRIPVAALPNPGLVRGLGTNAPPPERIILFVPLQNGVPERITEIGLARGRYTSAGQGLNRGLFARPMVANWRGTSEPASRR